MSRLPELLRVLTAADLSPIVDHPMAVVRSECPACFLGEADPLRIHRPLVIHHAAQPMRLACPSGCTREQIRAALLAGPVDWRSIAEEYRSFALELVAVVDTLLDEHRSRPALAAAA